MIPAIQSDVWKLATEMEKIQALVTLSGLPSRETTAGELDNAAFMVALDGVTRHALSESVKFILRGSLKHAFLPSPPELRMECDKAMAWHENQRVRVLRQERIEREMPVRGAEPTAAERARVSRLYADFCKGYEKAATEETFRLDPELVALVPDNPKAIIHQRNGA